MKLKEVWYADIMNTPTRTTTIRMQEATAESLELVARADNLSVSEEVWVAINECIDARKADPDFQKRLTDLFETERDVFEKLATMWRLIILI